MKLLLSIVLIFAVIVTPSPVFAADDTVEKTDCKLAIGYDSMDELKADLLLSAKRLAVNELFGELIASATAVDDFVVTSDQIRASSLGLVREDAIRYYNGDNLGEVCITISVYTTAEDRQQFVPVKLNKRNCVSNPDMTNRELRKFAEDEAVIKALVEYNRKLEGQVRNTLINLMQRVTYLENGMLPDTDSYCVRVEGYVTPIEVLALLGTDESTAENSKRVDGSASTGSSASSSTIPFGDIDDPTSLNPVFGWHPGQSTASSYEIDPESNTLTLIAGRDTDQWIEVETLPMVLYPVEGNFTAQVKITVKPQRNYQFAGLGMKAVDKKDFWIRIDRGFFDKHVVGIAALQNGKPILGASNTYTAETIYLRIRRNDSLVTLSYSANGTNWVFIKEDHVTELPEKVQLYLYIFSAHNDEGMIAKFEELKIIQE